MKHVIRGILLGGFLLAIAFMFTAGEALAAQPLLAPNAKLKGTYVWTRFRTCVQTNGGFTEDDALELTNPQSLPICSSTIISNCWFANTRSNVIRNEVTFNGDGTGTTDSEGTSLRLATRLRPNRQPISHSNAMCDFTYTVGSDNSFELTVSTCTSTSTQGSNIGDSSTLTGVVIRGQIAHGGQTLVIGDNDTNVEKIWQGLNPDFNTDPDFQRICIRSGAAVRRDK